ncbi:MAG: hypothetical protein ABIL58_15285 [Pseudomonadota bacterium]
MTYERQETRPVNTAEVLPPEMPQDLSVAIPNVIPRSPMDWPVERFSEALVRREDNRKALLRWISSNLQAGVDYGQIHVVKKDNCRLANEGRAHECIDPRHWSKPSLWKPGAEKICGMLGLIPRFPNLSEYENAVIRGEDINVIILKCELHTGNGFVAAEGTGARRVGQDNGDINKSLKMAMKSAHIDAALRVAGLSELFTQDLEDSNPGAKQGVRTGAVGGNQASAPAGGNGGGNHQPSNGNHSRQHSGNGNNNGGRLSGKQYSYIMNLLQSAGMTKQALDEHCLQAYGSAVDYITKSDASSLIDWLRNR